MKLGLCLMMKNEEAYLPEFFETSKKYVDTYYVLDTGSTDQSLAIAKKYTTNIWHKSFTNDFSEMRNDLLAKTETEWLIFLDADELLAAEMWEQLRSLISNSHRLVGIGGFKLIRYNFFATGGWYTDMVLKLFLNDKNFKYSKKVTERIEPAILAQGYQVLDSQIMMNHLGHLRPFAERQGKSLAYISLLKEELAETPHQRLDYARLALIERNTGSLAEGLVHSKLGVTSQPDNVIANTFHGHLLRATGDAEGALVYYQRAREQSKTPGLIENMIGLIYLSEGNYSQALTYFENAYQENPHFPHILVNLGLVHFFQEDYALALDCFETVAKANPYFLQREALGILEFDPYKSLHYETIANYWGLESYIEICEGELRKG